MITLTGENGFTLKYMPIRGEQNGLWNWVYKRHNNK